MAHQCDALVVVCIDFRFQKFIRVWTDKKLKDNTFDLVALAGATKDLKTILKQVDISVRLHHIKRVYLIHHEDCGAYGKEGTKERHTRDLKKAKEKILAKYPKLKVETFFLHLNGSFEKVS